MPLIIGSSLPKVSNFTPTGSAGHRRILHLALLLLIVAASATVWLSRSVDNLEITWDTDENRRLRQKCPELLTEIDARHSSPSHDLVDTPPDQVPTPETVAKFAARWGSSRVPKSMQTVIQVGKSRRIPLAVRRIMHQNRDRDPDVTFRYFSIKEARDYIRRNSNATVLDAFDAVQSVQVKADLFKYLYLLDNGGVALDLTLESITPLAEQLPLIADRFTATVTGSFIACNSANPVMKWVVHTALTQVIRRLYGGNERAVAGGGLFASALRSISQSGLSFRDINLLAMDQKSGCALGRLIFNRRPLYTTGRVAMEVRSYMEHRELADLWARRALYHGDNGAVSDEEITARRVCPFGQTEAIAYNPVETPMEERVLYETVRESVATMPVNRILRIPRIIVQTGKAASVPVGFLEASQLLRAMNRDFAYRYYTDEEARAFIEKNMPANVTETFDTLIPGAFKADFFRYVFLYVNGGVYIDGDEVPLVPLSTILESQDTFVSAEDPYAASKALYNAFIASVPRHPIMAEVINQIVRFVLRREECDDPLGVTGPVALGRVFTKVIGEIQGNYRYGRGVRLWAYHRDDKCSIGFIRTGNVAAFQTRYPTYKKEMRWYTQQEHYWDLCRRQAIYAEIPVPLEVVAGSGVTRSPAEVAVLRERIFARRVCEITASDDRHDGVDEASADPIKVVTFGSASRTSAPSPTTPALPGLFKGISGTAHSMRTAKLRTEAPQTPAPTADETSSIPRRIIHHGMLPQLPEGLARAAESFRKHNPDFEHLYFSDRDAAALLMREMSAKTAAHYRSLPTWEEKARFFCIMYLALHGGICVELGIVAKAPFFFEGDDVFVGLETLDGSSTLSMEVVASVKGHWVIVDTAKALLLAHRSNKALDVATALNDAFALRSGGKRPSGNTYYSIGGGKVRVMRQRPIHRMCLERQIVWHALFLMADTYETLYRDLNSLGAIWGMPKGALFNKGGKRHQLLTPSPSTDSPAPRRR